MIDPVCWEPERVREVLTTESRQKARTLFLRTHRPFQRIWVDFCKESGTTGTFIDEERLRAIVAAGALDAHNRLFFVVGEPGSGKSELCQWLEYTADQTHHIPVHIPRSMTSAAHVTALLRRSLATVDETALRHAPVAAQAAHTALSATVLLYEQGVPELAPVDHWADLLASDVLRGLLQAYLLAAGTVQAGPLLTDTQIQTLCQASGLTVEPQHFSATARALRRLLERALEQTLWLGDMRDLLARLARRAVAAGRRPLLLLEDITAFQLLGDRLLDYLLDLSNGHFDAVIGITTGYERTQIAGASLAHDLTHIHHRLRARFVLTDEQGRAYGLEEDLVEFVRGYLRAVRPDCHACPLHSECTAAFGLDLYPFTETALLRALRNLQEEGNPRQTPRLFLEHVLGAALLSKESPPITLDRSAFLLRPPDLFRSDDIPDPNLQSLLRWYGEVGDEVVTLDIRIAARWGVAVPPERCADGMLQVERAYVARPQVGKVTVSDWQQDLRDLQRWLGTGGLYPSRETLKRGVEQVVLALGDPRALGSRDSLAQTRAEVVYARGDERLPIALDRGSGDLLGGDATVKLQIVGLPEERSILEELAYLALSGDDLAQIAHNLALTLDWAQRHWDTYHSAVQQLLTDRLGGVTVEQLILIGWRLVCALVGDPWSDRPHTRACGPDTAPYAQLSPWTPDRHSACYSTGEALVGQHETLRRLFIGIFMLRDTVIDLERFQTTLRTVNTPDLLNRLARLPLASLRKLPFKIRPLGHHLYDLLVPLHRYALALVQIDIASTLRVDLGELGRCEAALRAHTQTDLAQLRRQLAELPNRCGELGVAWREPWDTAAETLLGHSCEHVTELLLNMEQMRHTGEQLLSSGVDLWSYQELRLRLLPLFQHPLWPAFQTLHQIQTELHKAARARYRLSSKEISGTKAYRALEAALRRLRKELGDE
ncbi:MAG: hypothetical protein OHK0022_19230 [Roseiflexaceae bacterium]